MRWQPKYKWQFIEFFEKQKPEWKMKSKTVKVLRVIYNKYLDKLGCVSV